MGQYTPRQIAMADGTQTLCLRSATGMPDLFVHPKGVKHGALQPCQLFLIAQGQNVKAVDAVAAHGAVGGPNDHDRGVI